MREGKGVKGKRSLPKGRKNQIFWWLVVSPFSASQTSPSRRWVGREEKLGLGEVTGKVWPQELTHLHRGVPGLGRDKSLATAL